MGYTHYWTQTRNLSREEWAEITADAGEILKYVQHMAGVPLGDGAGEPRSQPEINAERIFFNGIGDDGHETFGITPQANGDFCKTARKPYDLAVTACLCYLSTCLDPAAFSVSSDGHGHDFIAGLDAARKALPRKANVLDIPRGVMERDRWTGPWVHIDSDKTGFDINFCLDGKGYITHAKSRTHYRFATHRALAEFLDRTKLVKFRTGGSTGWGSYPAIEPNIWNATGSFDAARHDRIVKAQIKILSALFPVPPEHAEAPPAFVRPMDFPRPEDNGTFHYYFADLLASVSN